MEYCSRNSINYCTLKEQLGKSCLFFYDDGLRMLASNQYNRDSFERLHTTKNEPRATIPLHALKGLSLLCNDDIPLFIIGKFCQKFVNKQTSDGVTQFGQDTSETWLVQANRFVQALKLGFPLSRSDNHCISIPKYFMQFVKNQLESEKIVVSYLERSIFVLCQMLSKDNRHSAQDLELKQARKHFESLLQNAHNFLEMEYKLKKQSENDFIICMGRLKLQALLGQALVQSRDESTRKEALEILRRTIDETWEICQSGQSFLSCFKSQHDSSIFDYDGEKSPKKIAKKVVEKCISASQKIDPKYISKLMEINLVVNKEKFEDCVNNYAVTANKSKDQAESKLAPIWKIVEKEGTFGPKEITLLRETGNLLSDEEYRKCFFAEFFCSVLHIIGRQDLYIWKARMDMELKNEIEQCQYSSELSHYIAVEFRQKTNICLLYEYITIANCKVPRMLQNRVENESNSKRQKRLDKVISTCENLQQNQLKHFEDGLYMATFLSSYSKLNIAKYLVKAANKKLKTSSNENQPIPHPNAQEWCRNLLELAKEQIGFDMGPTCVLAAAKYYASVKMYQQAFDAFKFAFEAKKHGDDEPYFAKYLKQRPKTYAWGIMNCARAITEEGNGLNEPWKANVKEMCQKAYDNDHPSLAHLKVKLNTYIGNL
uniref:Uncharacterized protein LOC100180356 n=1 Tax=Phallusia mammillata TaxID=59560 RepID=A0A6F9DHW5_9ASCI|nr:uncharacterized protein LOC100180356 [Phallusia mammillata]